MNPNYLDFEQPIADLESKIQDLRNASTGPAVNVDTEVRALSFRRTDWFSDDSNRTIPPLHFAIIDCSDLEASEGVSLCEQKTNSALSKRADFP